MAYHSTPFRSRAGFTLIELLTVIAIILVLAGLLLNVAGNANYKSSVARATAEIKAMETACESYKADNGTYPRSTATDAVNANATTPLAPSDSKCLASCEYLYLCLSGLPATGTTYNKRYMDFKPGQLSTGTANPTANTTYIIDPFGFCYGYSTANQAAQDGVNAGTANQSTLASSGFNPTFDLWSTAGYSTSGGKSYPTGASSGATAIALWAKNW